MAESPISALGHVTEIISIPLQPPVFCGKIHRSGGEGSGGGGHLRCCAVRRGGWRRSCGRCPPHLPPCPPWPPACTARSAPCRPGAQARAVYWVGILPPEGDGLPAVYTNTIRPPPCLKQAKYSSQWLEARAVCMAHVMLVWLRNQGTSTSGPM